MRTPRISDDLIRTHPSRPLPWLPWAASGLFVIGVLALIATLIAAMVMDDDDNTRLRVLDAESSAPLSNAVVTIDGATHQTDDDGYVSLPAGSDVAVAVSHDGYISREGSVSLAGDAQMDVMLRPVPGNQSTVMNTTDTTAQQAVLDNVEGTPEIMEEPSPTNDQDEQSVTSPPPATPAASELAGRIMDAAGEPVQGALLTDGTTFEITGADGLFALRAQDFASETLRISASGYADTTLSFANAGGSVDVELQLQPVKAIYYNPNISTTQEDLDRLIDIINTTEVNAIVIDVKEELIFYDSQVPFFREVDIVRPVIDVPALLAQFQEHNIYTIARHVVFKDSLIAQRRPDLSVRHTETGEPWRDMNGVAWVNPMLHDLWYANIELAVELGELGFDEIQYDYVRFPTDGDFSTMDFGLPLNEENRVRAITRFLEWSKEALLPTGAKLSADVFGFTVLVSDDLGIGQDLTEIAPHLDYISPMVYPSHFPDGAMGLDGHPNDFPYETIEISMSAGASQLGSALQLRPWLQDFNYWEMRDYGPEEVRAQIDAAEAVGTSGWMLWDPNNRFTVEALGPDDGNMSRFVPPSAVLPGQGMSRALTRRPAA
jgi:hypothetical protein